MISLTLILVDPIEWACTIFPFATCTNILDLLMSEMRSDLYGVMWMLHPESINHSLIKV